LPGLAGLRAIAWLSGLRAIARLSGLSLRGSVAGLGAGLSAVVRLSGALGTAETDEKPHSFPLPFKADVLPWVKAMQRAAYGYDDGFLVRHMSLEENKVNNQTDKTGAVKDGCGLVPHPLEQDKQSFLKVPRPKKNT